MRPVRSSSRSSSVGDQEAREREEDVDPDEAARDRRRARRGRRTTSVTATARSAWISGRITPTPPDRGPGGDTDAPTRFNRKERAPLSRPTLTATRQDSKAMGGIAVLAEAHGAQ